MKTALTFLMISLAICFSQTPVGIKQNSFTTNSDSGARLVITNIVNGLLVGQQYISVSGCGELLANGNYFDNGIGFWTNGFCYIYKEPFIVIPPPRKYRWDIISNSGNNLLYNTAIGYNPLLSDPWFVVQGAPPVPIVKYAYTGATGFVTEPVLRASGGLTSINFTNYADTNGAGLYLYQDATNFASTQTAGLVTISQLSIATNNFWSGVTNYVNAATNGLVKASITNGLATTSYVSSLSTNYVSASITNGLATLVAATNISASVYSNNPSGYIKPPATNNITKFGSGVISSITNGGGLSISSVTNIGSGVSYTITVSGTNIVSITNINAVTLAGWGAFTTNQSSWAAYLAPRGDWTNSQYITNGLISSAAAAATYQPTGNYLIGTSSLNYTHFTNPPIIASTNGFVGQSVTNGIASISYVNTATNGLVTSSVTNGLATTAYVNASTNGFVRQSITNGLASIQFVYDQNYLAASNVINNYATTSSVNSAFAPYPIGSNLITTSNALQRGISTNANSILLKWGTNTYFVGGFVVNSNMTASYATNSGVIVATFGSTTNLYASSSAGLQPSTKNLTNWSTIGTNQILITTNLIYKIIQGNNVLVSYTTNSSGVKATLNAYYQYNSPIQSGKKQIPTPVTPVQPTETNTFSITYDNPLPAPESQFSFFLSGTKYTVPFGNVTIKNSTTNGVTIQDISYNYGAGFTLTAGTTYGYVAICY